MVSNNALPLDFVQLPACGVSILLPSGEHMVDRMAQQVGYRHDSFLVPDLGFEALIFRLKGAPLGPGRRPGAFGQSRPEPRVAVRGVPALILAGALIVPGTDSAPRTQVSGIGKLLHGRSGFGQQIPGRFLLDSWNRLQQFVRFLLPAFPN